MPRRRPDESGRGLIGFLIAIVVVGFVGYSLKQIFVVKHRYDQFDTFAYELISNADRRKLGEDDMKFELIKKGRELGIPMDPKTLVVHSENAGRRLRYEYDDPVVLPGYTYSWHFVVDQSWKKF